MVIVSDMTVTEVVPLSHRRRSFPFPFKLCSGHKYKKKINGRKEE